MTMTRSISLQFKQGGSDKVYHVQLNKIPPGWVVNFQYGRRGNALTAGTKTAVPVELAEAESIYDKIVAEKIGKGYIVVGSGSQSHVGTASAEIITEMLPQLLTEISEDEAEKYITDDDYCAQEKLDGRNKTLRLKDGIITSTNKKGQSVPTPDAVHKQAVFAKRDFIAQAEHIGDVYHVHNVSSYDGLSIADEPYNHRLAKAVILFPWTEMPVRVVETAGTTEEKRAMFKLLKKRGCEGIVFKRKDAKFQAGYTDTQFKCKFWKSLSARIRTIRPGGKESIECELWNIKESCWQTCGNVTVLKRGLIDTLKIGMKVEVKYLYAVRGSDILYQPSPCMTGDTFRRDDVEDYECSTRQLKYKPEPKE